MADWEVELLVSSNSKISRNISFLAPKGNVNPFYSKIQISNYYNSLTINIQAIADTEEDAIDAAFYFIGQALNYISWFTRSPFELFTYLEQSQLRKRTVAKQVLTKETWEKAFINGRNIQVHKPKLAMSLGWYRKSLNCEDPIDSFLSTWLVIETLCNDITLSEEYRQEQKLDKADGQDKGKIFYQIKQYLHERELSTYINFDRFYKIKNRRNDIAHGSFVINDIDIIKEIVAMNDEIMESAYMLLSMEVQSSGYE